MTTGLPNWLALILAFVYVFVAIGLGEVLRRSLHLSQGFTRKFIHIAVGMISIPTVLMFRSLYWAIIPPLAFVVINYLDYRFGLIQAMMSSNRSNLGTVYFPISFAVILAVFWGNPSDADDAPASHRRRADADDVGRRAGRRRRRANRTASLHHLGPHAQPRRLGHMFVVSALATWLALGSLSLVGGLRRHHRGVRSHARRSHFAVGH